MPYDHITFGLALIGFALLAADASRRFVGRRSTALTLISTTVILVHVGFVWAFRFDWSFAAMWQKSAFAFLLFHGATLVIAGSVIARDRLRDRLVFAAFGIVCVGALGAPFRYPELAMLQLPVPAVFVAALIWTGSTWRTLHRPTKP
ncbi:MAG: hypothetical protein NXI31_06875 [bacterium]|nr:hypothetical protein [bacterium]